MSASDAVYEHLSPGKTQADVVKSVMQLHRSKGGSYRADVIQLQREVFGTPPKRAVGFDQDAMYEEFKKSPEALALEEEVGAMGFKYVGATGTASKANTNFATKEIRINADLSPQEAALSFVYELKNASQRAQFDDLIASSKQGKGDDERARKYAEDVVRLESKSVLARSKVAIAMDRQSLIKNQKYNEIALQDLSDPEREDLIFEEMKKNGKVNQNTKPVLEHYIEQFWKNNKKGQGKG